MDYQETLNYLYESAPMFQQIGGKAYKPGIETTLKLDKYFGHPHQQFKTIHIAGTNGKGSCSHTIAAVLQSAGYKVGLYTSPHLVDFRERIRINGEMIPEEYVVNFVEKHRAFFEPLYPSFFELTTAMAFRYFADQKVDVAVIEVGMGGRLDCTNIITPDVSVITNIGLDHMQYLGDTLTKIAIEKAGVIKENIPVVVGRASGAVKRVFTVKAKTMNSDIIYAEHSAQSTSIHLLNIDDLIKRKTELSLLAITEINDEACVNESIKAIDRFIETQKDALVITNTEIKAELYFELNGNYQAENCLTILSALSILKKMGYTIRLKDYLKGFSSVCELTGLTGRWQKLQSSPEIRCDTGHNADGFKYLSQQLQQIHEKYHKELHIVFGMVNDKDIRSVLELLPKEATYYFTKASVKRALHEDELMRMALEYDLHGNAYPSVVEAVEEAKKNCLPKDFIFIGGSNFIVADVLTNRNTLNFH